MRIENRKSKVEVIGVRNTMCHCEKSREYSRDDEAISLEI